MSQEEGNRKAKEIGALLYEEVSAVDNLQIQNLFQELGSALFKQNEEDLIPDVSSLFQVINSILGGHKALKT